MPGIKRLKGIRKAVKKCVSSGFEVCLKWVWSE